MLILTEHLVGIAKTALASGDQNNFNYGFNIVTIIERLIIKAMKMIMNYKHKTENAMPYSNGHRQSMRVWHFVLVGMQILVPEIYTPHVRQTRTAIHDINKVLWSLIKGHYTTSVR
jgi:hypothetical protein